MSIFIEDKKRQIFNFLGITDLHDQGVKGQGVKFIELESPGSAHGQEVLQVFSEVAPESEAILMGGGYVVEGGQIAPGSILLETLDFAIANNVKIIGASRGGSDKQYVVDAFKPFLDNGGILITSSGNNYGNIDDIGGFSNTEIFISVAACNWDTNFRKIERLSYASYGQDLDFILPIFTKRQGTSFVSPFLAGMVALILQKVDMNQNQMFDFLREISVDILEEGKDIESGYGMPSLIGIDLDNITVPGEDSNMLDIRVYDGQLARNFNVVEFKCKNNGEILLNADFIDHVKRLQIFREWYNRPIKILSGYRTEEYNRKIGGAVNSKHMLGIATDFELPEEFYSFTDKRKDEFVGNVIRKWSELCRADGFVGGIGIYDTFIHLDSRKTSQSGQTIVWDDRTTV